MQVGLVLINTVSGITTLLSWIVTWTSYFCYCIGFFEVQFCMVKCFCQPSKLTGMTGRNLVQPTLLLVVSLAPLKLESCRENQRSCCCSGAGTNTTRHSGVLIHDWDCSCCSGSDECCTVLGVSGSQYSRFFHSRRQEKRDSLWWSIH